VFRFGASSIEEVGHYIDEEGNNFWGVETFVPNHEPAGTWKAGAYSRALTATAASSSSATRETEDRVCMGAAFGPPLAPRFGSAATAASALAALSAAEIVHVPPLAGSVDLSPAVLPADLVDDPAHLGTLDVDCGPQFV
jgi:hypothetical protein